MTQIGIGASIVIQQELGTVLFSPSWDNVPLASSDSEVTNGATVGSYVKLKEIQMKINGTVRVKFDLKEYSTPYIAYGKIYKNGVAYGIEHTSSIMTYATISEDLAFVTGDLIQLYLKNNDYANYTFSQNFRIFGSPYSQFTVNI